jgi:hypothetical protein
LREYLLGTGAEPAVDLWTLFRARALAPEHPLPRYLLGRRLVLAGDPGSGAPELAAALASGGLGPEATMAGAELLGRAEFAAGRFQAAGEAFERILASEADGRLQFGSSGSTQLNMNQGQRLGIEDWLERARWAAGRGDSTAARYGRPPGTR